MIRHLVAASDIDRLNCVTIALVDITYDADAKWNDQIGMFCWEKIV